MSLNLLIEIPEEIAEKLGLVKKPADGWHQRVLAAQANWETAVRAARKEWWDASST